MSTERYLNPEQSQANRMRREERALADFPAARRLAAANGMKLIQYSSIHYSLRSIRHGWLTNVYPSNQRIYADPHAKGPFLGPFANEWTLLDVVRTAIGVEANE